MKVMKKDGITRVVNDFEAVRLKASGYIEVERPKEKKPYEKPTIEDAPKKAKKEKPKEVETE